ncbi:MAG: DUF1828 domain-containing protein [Clostridiales bacterium]|nr:DUF1828 domain-containing protein [Clostridiales bacterium]
MNDLIYSYYNWLKNNTICSEVNNYTKVSTPFLDRHNDCIEFYMKLDNNGDIFITDDGYTLGDLEDYGFTFNTPKRKSLLNEILNIYHIKEKDNCLTVTTSKNNFPIAKHFFIQAIIAINDLYNLNKSNVVSLFVEEFSSFLYENGIFYSENVKVTGKSGFDHNIDYLIPGNNKNPEKYLKIINNPDKSNTQNTMFLWDDLKYARKQTDIMMVVLNDIDHKVQNDIISAYKKYDITPLMWSDKTNILENLKIVV